MLPLSTSDDYLYRVGQSADSRSRAVPACWVGDVLPALTILAVFFKIASFNKKLVMAMMKRWRGQSFEEERTS